MEINRNAHIRAVFNISYIADLEWKVKNEIAADMQSEKKKEIQLKCFWACFQIILFIINFQIHEAFVLYDKPFLKLNFFSLFF